MPLQAGANAGLDRRLVSLIAFLFGLHLLQAFSPLRLDHDAVLYLRMAIGFAEATPVAGPDFPPGYPALIALLDIAGLGSPFWFILVNWFAVAGGLYAVWRLPGAWTPHQRLLAIALTLLSFAVIRTVVRPLSDPLFFALSMLSLLAMSFADRDETRNRFTHLVLAAALAVLAISIRLIGVAILPALGFAVMKAVLRTGRARRQMMAASTIAVTGSAAIVIFLARHSLARYLGGFGEGWEGNVMMLASMRFGVILANLSELFMNLPHKVVPSWNVLSVAVGVVPALILLLGLRGLKGTTATGVYAAASIAILFLWPYNAVRLWVPMAPLIFLHLTRTLSEMLEGNRDMGWIRRPLAGLAGVWAIWFLATGMGALAYSTLITFSGSRFSSLYGSNGGFSTPGQVSKNPQHNARAMEILLRYDPAQAARAGDLLPRSAGQYSQSMSLKARITGLLTESR